MAVAHGNRTTEDASQRPPPVLKTGPVTRSGALPRRNLTAFDLGSTKKSRARNSR